MTIREKRIVIDPESISTEIVSAAVAVYDAFWPKSPECKCGRAAVCLCCEWPWQAEQLQARIDASGLSVPVPVIDLGGKAPEIPSGNPLTRKPYFKALKPSENLDAQARKVAQSVARSGLPAFYLDNSRAIDLTLDGQAQALDDVALYAPALVYCHNHDRRGDDISRLLARLYSRSFGICYLIESEGL